MINGIREAIQLTLYYMRKPWKLTEKQKRRHLLHGRYKGCGLSTVALNKQHVQLASTRSIRQYNKRELYKLMYNWKEDDNFKNSHYHDILANYW